MRRQSRQIMVGSVPVGGDAPITVQTMTNTPTEDAVATIDQIRRCEDAGADLIRVSCPDVASTAALGKIVKASRIPIIADIHFHYKRALKQQTPARPACASTPATSVRPIAWPKWCAREGQRLRHPHRRERRQPGTASAGKVRRALPEALVNPRSIISSCCKITISMNTRWR
jgi:hypothetical protein